MQITDIISNTNRPPNNTRSLANATAGSALGIGEHAIVQADIHPGRRGRVHFRTDWFARALHNQYIPAGTTVVLLQREGVTWLVTPAFEHRGVA